MLTFDAAAHEYRWDGVPVPSVTQVIEDAGLKPPYAGDGSAAKRGTKVHELLELYDKGELDVDAWLAYDSRLPEDKRLKPYFDAYMAFRSDCKCEWKIAEGRLYSPALMVAGTVDRMGLVNGEPAILDLKTTNGVPPYAATAVQTAGYHLLSEDTRQANRFALALHGDGTYKLIMYRNQQDYQAFKSAAFLYHWKRQK